VLFPSGFSPERHAQVRSTHVLSGTALAHSALELQFPLPIVNFSHLLSVAWAWYPTWHVHVLLLHAEYWTATVQSESTSHWSPITLTRQLPPSCSGTWPSIHWHVAFKQTLLLTAEHCRSSSQASEIFRRVQWLPVSFVLYPGWHEQFPLRHAANSTFWHSSSPAHASPSCFDVHPVPVASGFRSFSQTHRPSRHKLRLIADKHSSSSTQASWMVSILNTKYTICVKTFDRYINTCLVRIIHNYTLPYTWRWRYQFKVSHASIWQNLQFKVKSTKFD